MSAPNFKKVQGLIAGLAGESRTAIYEIRDRVEDLQAERRRVQNTPDDPASIRARIDAAIARAANQVEFFRPLGIENGGSHDDVAALFDRKFALRPFVALAAIAPDKLGELLASGAPINGMQPAQKAVKLDDLNRQLLAAEIAEELACREMDDLSSGHFPRRPDADPAVLLAPTSELE